MVCLDVISYASVFVVDLSIVVCGTGWKREDCSRGLSNCCMFG